MPNELVYDVGLFDGEDTAYYLFRGCRVVAIDANPMMIEQAKQRFSKEIAEGRLTLLNVGVAREAGVLTFWVSDKPEWSSFDKAIASRDGKGHRAIEIPTRPFSEIMAAHGLPHYLKVDIEGHDHLCVEALSGSSRPRYVSVESECVGERQLSEDESLAMLNLLHAKGYTKFKLVSQTTHYPTSTTSSLARFGRRMMFRLAWGRVHIPVISPMVARHVDPLSSTGVKFEFKDGATGPWGEEIRGDWMPLERARDVYLRERREYFKFPDSTTYGFWFDWHATR